jgi:hypothetical protein
MCTLKITYHEKNVWSILIIELCLKRWERTKTIKHAGRITRKQESPNELYNADEDTPNKNMHNTESALVATSADSVPSSYLVRITIAPIGTTFGNLQ